MRISFCGPHYQRLCDVVDDRGLTTLVSESGEEAVHKYEAAMQEGLTIDNFDPLMGAYNAIVMHALQQVGPDVFLAALHGDVGTDPFDIWIEYAVDDQVALWKSFSDD